MGTTAEKIEYLNETKELIKQSLNDLGAEIENSDSFRNYVQKINTLYEDWPKITEEGTSLSLNSTQKGKMKIELKGNTLQDGEPTPDSPVDINVVSGRNVIVTSNKNLLDISALNTRTVAGVVVTNNGDGSFTLNGTSSSNGEAVDIPINIPLKNNTTYTYSKTTKTNVAVFAIILYNSSQQTIVSLDSGSTSTSFTPQSDVVAKSFRLYFAPSKTFSNHTIYPMLEINSTATPFTEHQDKELPLDLPVKNLFNLSTLQQGGLDLGATGQKIVSSTRISTDYIVVKPNTSYTISRGNTNIANCGIGLYKSDNSYDSSHKINNGIWINMPATFTTQSDTKYIRVAFKKSDDSSISPTGDYKINIEEGSKANAYTPYGTAPIELCKIGNYQDYFYKENNKWYLHKEIGKKTLNGSENWEDRPNYTNADRFVLGDATIPPQPINGYSKYFVVYKVVGDEMGILENNGAQIIINFSTKGTTTLVQFKEWLSTHNTSIYYILGMATNTEITDTTLISQLEAMPNAISYNNQTNITQENNDLPFILNISALQKNSN